MGRVLALGCVRVCGERKNNVVHSKLGPTLFYVQFLIAHVHTVLADVAIIMPHYLGGGGTITMRYQSIAGVINGHS